MTLRAATVNCHGSYGYNHRLKWTQGLSGQWSLEAHIIENKAFSMINILSINSLDQKEI